MKLNLVSVVVLLALVSCGYSYAQNTKQPNFVFFLGEGQGWASTSIQIDPNEPQSKSASFHTPNLGRLAREGVCFSNYYAPSPRCTPSRATYFTGLSPARLHMTFTSAGGDTGRTLVEPRTLQELPSEVVTIAELLKVAGYATAHFGKWHVGRADPRQHGFDESDGATSNSGPENSPNPNPKQAYGMAERGIAFIERQVKKQQPFYLQLSQYGGRSEVDARPETFEQALKLGLGRNEANIGAAAVALDMDITLGMLLDKLDELGISENTYVIYTADHGTPGRNGPLQGGKGGLWDGGIRIPLLIRGPAAKPGSHSSVRVTGADLVPTIADLAGVAEQLSQNVEGVTLKEVLNHPESGGVKRPNNQLVFHFPHYDKDSLGPVSAIIVDNFKLMRVYEDGSFWLFDLSTDIGENNNLADSMPDKVRELDLRLAEYLRSVDADLPTVSARSVFPSESGQSNGRGRQDVLLDALDENHDGQLTENELVKLPALLRSLDKDGSGSVSREEIELR